VLELRPDVAILDVEMRASTGWPSVGDLEDVADDRTLVLTTLGRPAAGCDRRPLGATTGHRGRREIVLTPYDHGS